MDLIFEFEFDLNNSYEPTDQNIIDSLPSEYQKGDLEEDMINSDEVVQQVGLDGQSYTINSDEVVQ